MMSGSGRSMMRASMRVSEDSSPLQDNGAWKVLEDFLTTDVTFAQMEEKLESYLGSRYHEIDWRDAKSVLFSGDGDDTLALENLRALKAKYTAASPCFSGPSGSSISGSSSIPTCLSKKTPASKSRVRKLRKRSRFNPFIDIEADDDDDDDDDDDGEEDGDDAEEDDGHLSDSGNMTNRSHLTMRFPPGPSAKDNLAASIDEIFQRYQESPISSSQGLHVSEAASFPNLNSVLPSTLLQSFTSRGRLYRVRVRKSATDYIANHLRKRGFEVVVSTWVSGDLYVSADSPKSISESLPPSHSQEVTEYIRISEEERNTSSFTLCNPAWVKIKKGVYKNDIGYVFDSAGDQFNDFVAVLVPPRNFPYPMSQDSVALLDRSRLPHDGSVSDILREEQVVGCSYRGEQYYKGLLLKYFRYDCLELVDRPHVDDIRLHLQSGWDFPFLEKTKVTFSLQFLRAGDTVRVIRGDLCTCVATVISVNQIYQTATLEIVSDGKTQRTQVRLGDIERVFHVGETVRVVAGSYLGLEGYIVEMNEEIFHVCQGVSGEQVEVSKYYLDHCDFDHRFSSTLPMQPSCETSTDGDDIQIGDYIKVLSGEHNGKYGTVRWLDGTDLWFIDETNISQTTGFNFATSGVRVPTESVRRLHFPNVLKFTKESGYNVKPGDNVLIARGPHYGITGTVQSVDFPNASLKLKCDNDNTSIAVPIRFAIMQNAMLSSDKFDTFIGKEVFVIAGDYKGYRGTLLGTSPEFCHIAMHGHPRLTLKRSDVVTEYGTRLNGVVLDSLSMATFCKMRAGSYVRIITPRSATPPPSTQVDSSRNSEDISGDAVDRNANLWTAGPQDILNMIDSHERASLASNRWTVDHQDTLDNLEQSMQDLQENAYNGPLVWLMNKEFSSILHNYHAVLKVSVNFMGGRLSKRFVSTTCPDPFCGKNGPVPQGSVAVFCTSNSAGAAIQYYDIPVKDLSPAPPRKKQQYCLVLDGPCRGQVVVIMKCNSKNNTVTVNGLADPLHFNQICLVVEATM